METLSYKNEQISYEMIRKRIKNIYIHIKEAKVIVTIPYKMEKGKAISVVEEKKKWIFDRVRKQKQNPKEEKMTEKELEILKQIVQEKVPFYAEKIGEHPNKVRIRDLNYAWGSCSAKKNISINEKLAKYSEREIEYVILHELCHLKHMNHSKQFWNLVEEYMPDYKSIRKELK